MSAEDPFAGTESSGAVDYGDFSFRVKPYVLKGLALAAGVAVTSSDRIPVLECYRVRVGPGTLELAATDMERTVLASTAAVFCDSVPEHGYAEVFIPAKKLQAVLKEATDDSITVEVKKNRATVTAGSGSWVFALPDGSEYPRLPEPSELCFFTYPRERLLAALRAIRHAVCRDAGRPMLTQVAVLADMPRGDGGILAGSVTASDGTRFARAVLEGFPQGMCIPSPVLDDLTRLLSQSQAETIGVAVTEESLAFQADPVVLTVARRSTPFPDMDKLLLAPASENDQVFSVDCDELAAAVRRARVTADADTSAIALVVSDGTVTVVSRDKAGNSASVPVPAAWAGKERVLCVNHVFLTEMLAAHPGKRCDFRLGKDLGKKRSVILLEDSQPSSAGTSAVVQVLTQMASALVGY